ncbi:MAG: hypothetical protein ACR2QK_17550, partial [Acidimicrobiales bacterium]
MRTRMAVVAVAAGVILAGCSGTESTGGDTAAVATVETTTTTEAQPAAAEAPLRVEVDEPATG